MSSTYQNINPQTFISTKINFWARNPNFTVKHGYYMGIQRNGVLKGAQNGVQVTRSAHFSVFADSNNEVRNISPDRCTSGADGGAGISCAITYAWSINVERRVTAFISHNVTYAPWCPANSPASCTVFDGRIGDASGGALSQIGVWSIQQSVFGETTNGFSFLEIVQPASDPCPAAGSASGYFVVPFRVSAGGTTSISGTPGSDASTRASSCAKWWNDWVVTRITY